MKTLLCPFCHADTKLLDTDGNGFGYCYVHCPSCHASGPQCKDNGEAVRRWNQIAKPYCS